MENIRNGNMKVETLKEEVRKSLELIKEGYIHKRAERQLVDGAKFLEMISKTPYKNCDTVSELKSRISEERKKLKTKLEELDSYIPGHQFAIFETSEEIAKKEQDEITKEKSRLEKEIRWLHKCLGMCANRDYFK